MKHQSNYEYYNHFDSKLPFTFSYYITRENDYKNWHKDLEILYFLRGSGIVEYGTERIEAYPGRLIAINPNVLHNVTSDTFLEHYCLILDNEFFAELGINIADNAYAPIIEDSRAIALFEEIINSFCSLDTFTKALVITAIMNLLIYITKNYTYDSNTYKTEKNEYGITLAIGYILANLNKKLYEDELINQVGMSKYYFIREFKKTTGCTPIEFIHKNRCIEAKRMLRSGKLSISEISEQIGFESPAYFTKIFKRYIGTTPREYINSASKNKKVR